MSFFESIFYMAWRGIAIGLIISAPMGPVGMLCIQRTLDKGRRAGLYTGIGAAISDLFYSLLTGFGLSFIEDFLERNQNIIQLIGSFVLIGFGIYLFKKNPSKGLKKPVDDNVSVKKSILTGFLFTVSNPLILFLIIGLFARFNFILPAEPAGRIGIHVIQYIIGFAFIYIGAILWWWFITFSIDKVRSHFNIRSMWLVNKIIGAVIMLFAVVGIFTSVSALAAAENVKCWNSTRGFGPFTSSANKISDVGSRLTNNTNDTLFFMAPCGEADALEFRCKVRNHRGKAHWGIALAGHRQDPKPSGNELVRIDIRALEGNFDGISTMPVLEIEMNTGESEPTKKSFADDTDLLKRIRSGMGGPDPTGSQNFFKLVASNSALTLFGGLHSPDALVSGQLPEGFLADSIGFFITPGASISVDEIKLVSSRTDSYAACWTDLQELDDYLAMSHDPMEGYWQTLDRSLDESLLKLGGDYRYALVKSEGGYELVYLSGARVNGANWQPGMLKASLKPSGIEGIWDVTWHDAMHMPMSHELKAQTDPNGTLTIQFPYQDSQLRLHPSTLQAGSGH